MLLPGEFFDRNPGLQHKNLSIGFQPEIGSVGAPTFNGVLRFMTPEEVDDFVSGAAWDYHKFQPWSSKLRTNDTYDHVLAYFPTDTPLDAKDWAAASQLAAYSQYQSLFNGFISFIFEYTSAVIMWKTQSPWPVLRGFLYDWYLESTGSLRGVRASLGQPVSIVFDRLTWKLKMINRKVFSVEPCGDSSIGAEYTFFDLHGNSLDSGVIHISQDFVPAMSAASFNTHEVTWPADCSDVCFLRLQETGSCSSNAILSWYWLTDPRLGEASDFSVLGALRKRLRGRATMFVIACLFDQDGLHLKLSVEVSSDAPDVLFYPTFTVRLDDGSQVLPLLDNKDSDVVILPGSKQVRVLEARNSVRANGDSIKLQIILSSWNGVDITEDTICHQNVATVGYK